MVHILEPLHFLHVVDHAGRECRDILGRCQLRRTAAEACKRNFEAKTFKTLLVSHVVAPIERKLMAILPKRFLTKANVVANVDDISATAVSAISGSTTRALSHPAETPPFIAFD